MSGADDRVERMLLLCYMNQWSLQEFKDKLKAWYPNGPYPNGSGWDWDAVELEYNALMKDTKH